MDTFGWLMVDRLNGLGFSSPAHPSIRTLLYCSGAGQRLAKELSTLTDLLDIFR